MINFDDEMCVLCGAPAKMPHTIFCASNPDCDEVALNLLRNGCLDEFRQHLLKTYFDGSELKPEWKHLQREWNGIKEGKIN